MGEHVESEEREKDKEDDVDRDDERTPVNAHVRTQLTVSPSRLSHQMRMGDTTPANLSPKERIHKRTRETLTKMLRNQDKLPVAINVVSIARSPTLTDMHGISGMWVYTSCCDKVIYRSKC